MISLAIIIFKNDGRRYFIDEDKITPATFADFMECDWSYEDMGLKKVGEDGETLYEGYEFDGELTWEEIEDIETGWYSVSYWDGNNWQTDVFEYYDTEEFEIEELDPPSPAYYFPYLLKVNGEEIRCFSSNESGSLSPYYIEDIDY